MTAFEMETVESCRSLGIVPADRIPPRPARCDPAGMCHKLPFRQRQNATFSHVSLLWATPFR
jgi:hypothetical protein